jgi:8-oxo-dGTP diphosphatase
MIFRRKTYKIKPERLQEFNDFFHNYLYPNQIRHGAKLVGRWVNDDKTEIMALWEYDSIEQYESIEAKIRESELHHRAKERRMELGKLYLESDQEFFSPTTCQYQPPKHIVAVTAYITNEKGELLLVRNYHRSDTMEMPGGQVEEGETLEEAVHREIFEETGVTVSLTGVTGLYQNVSGGVICVVFKGEYLSGEVRPAEGETSDVAFVKVTKENINQYITRPHFRDRVLDSMEPSYIPYHAYKVRPFEILSQFKVKQDQD